MLKQKFILTYGIEFISLLFGIASGIIIARIGGPNVVGTLAFGMSFVAVFQFITDLGIGTAQQKLITSTDDIGDYIATFTVLKITTTFLFLIVIVSYYYLQVHFLGNHDINKPEIRTVIFIYIAIYFFDSLNYIFRTNFIAKTERAKVEIPTFFQTTSDKILRIVLILLGFGVIALATSSLIFVILVIPINYYLFKNYKFGTFRKDLIKGYISISIPVIIIIFTQQWADNIDRLMLRKLHGTYELGLYMAAFSLSAPVKLLGSSVSSILFPSFSSLIFKNKISEISALILKYRKYLVTFILPFIILMILFSSQIVLSLFGEKYTSTIIYFPFIITTLFIYIYTLPYLNLVYANGMFKQIAVISVVVLIIQAGLIYFLTAKTGFNLKGLGTSIALLITNIIIFLIYNKISKQILFIKTNKKIHLMIAIQIALGFLAMIILKSDLIILYFAVPILFLAITFLIEWGIKIITKDDIHFLTSIINLKPILKYVKDEINPDKPNETP
ncbi:MAG: oligosaccharide flippase family protein [Bacteroidales bacterium]